MGGPLGSDSGAPPSGSAPLPDFGLPQMPPSNVAALQAASGGVYAPLSASRSFALAASASSCLSALASVYNVQDLWWGQRFWRALDGHPGVHSIDSVVVTLLQQHGYSGPRCVTTPRMPELKLALERLALAGPAAGGVPSNANMADVGNIAGVTTNRW